MILATDFCGPISATFLTVGTAGRLLMSGEVQEVLPLEDSKKIDDAKPITPSAEVTFDTAKVETRHDSQVRNALTRRRIRCSRR